MKKVKVKERAAPTAEKKWEMKDRTYILKDMSPLAYILKCSNIYYFDKEAGYEREMKLTSNQSTPFVDEFKGDAKLEHVIFRDGVLRVKKNKQTLQKLLSLYHPKLNKLYTELDVVQEAKDELVDIELELEALTIAKNLDIDHAEAILRVEEGSAVSELTSKEIKRDVMLMAKNNPSLFLELTQDDNVELRNFGIKAVEAGVLSLSDDQRTINWAKNKRKVLTVPFDEHPYSALAAFFKTDEGLEIYKNIEKRLK